MAHSVPTRRSSDLVNEETTLEGSFRHFPLFRRALDFRSPVDAYFIGYSNGDFFMVRRMRSEGHRRLLGVGEEVHYVIQSIDREGGEARGLILHLDAPAAVLRQMAHPDYPPDRKTVVSGQSGAVRV